MVAPQLDFTPERAGWCAWTIPGLPHKVRTLVKEVEGRPVFAEVQVSGEDVSSADLARIPLRRMAAKLLASRAEAHWQRAAASTNREVNAAIAAGFYMGLARQYAAGKTDPLGRPGRRGPDDFYRELAAIYLGLALESNRPSAVIAEREKVPAPTVQRWVREARRRKLIPPARKGVAG